MQLFGRKPTVIWHDQKLGETLALFRKERTHLAIVRDVESEGEVKYLSRSFLSIFHSVFLFYTE